MLAVTAHMLRYVGPQPLRWAVSLMQSLVWISFEASSVHQ